jgi:hypothetical protein
MGIARGRNSARYQGRTNVQVTSPRGLQPAERDVSRWTASRLAWALWLLSMVLLLLSVLMGVRNAATVAAFVDDILVFVPMVVSFATVGTLIAARHPHNPIGWLFASFAAIVGLVLVAQEYATYALVTAPGSVPGGDWAAWLGAWSLGFTIASPALIFLLFPDGHLLSPRWRPLAWLIVATATLDVALAALSNVGVAEASPFATSPVQVLHGGVIRAVRDANQTVEAAVLLACALCLVVRLRRARGEQRQQLKWVAYTATVGFAAFAIVALAGWPEPVVVAIVAFPAVAIAAAIAIFKYHLYDIDRLISRTLVYAILTLVLGLGYASVVLVVGQRFGGVTRHPPSWAVAGATLAVAAAFQPARRRIQQAVDRRFNRRKYNAVKTIEAFSIRLRDHVDLDALSTELLAVVDQTMEPTQVSLWFRPSTQGSSGTARSEARPTSWAY